MSKLITLTKVVRKCSSQNYALNKENNKNLSVSRALNTGGKIILYVFLLLGAGLICWMLSMLAYSAAPSIAAEGIMPDAAAFVFFICQLLIFLICTPQIMSLFFLSNDISAYMHMPIKPSQLVGAKLFSVLPTGYIITACSALPVSVGALAALGASPMRYVTAVLACALLPVLPIVYISTLSIILMHLCKNFKKKETIVTVITYGISFLAVIVSFLPRIMSGSGDTEMTDEQLAGGLADLLKHNGFLKWVFPTDAFSGTAVFGGDPFGIVTAILIAAAAVALFAFIAQKFYINSAIGMKEGGSRRKKILLGSDHFKSSSVKKAFLQREKKIILRSPVFLINCLIWPVIMPFLLIASFLIGLGSSSSDIVKVVFGEQSHTLAFAPLLLAIIPAMISTVSKTTSTSLSREGSEFFVMRSMPVSAKLQLSAKYLLGFSVSLILSLPFTIGISLYFILTAGANWLLLPFAVIVSVCIAAIINDLQLFFDARNPKLYWESEETVIKKESRGLLCGLAGFLFVILLEGASVAAVFLLNIPDIAIISALSVILTAGAFVLHKAVLSHGARCMSRFEP